MTTTAREDLDSYIAQFPEDRVVEIPCPLCKVSIPVIKPERGERDYTSVMSCPDCNHMFFKGVLK